MGRFFPVGTKLQLPAMKVEVVEDLGNRFCEGCPFDFVMGDEFCTEAICTNVSEDGTKVNIKFKRLED